MKIYCKTCANYKMCTHKTQHERWTALANNCPDYCAIVPTTKAALQGALEERFAIVDNPRIQCDIGKIAQPDGVSCARQQAAFGSLQNHGVRMVDGIMMWVNPDTGELQKLDNQTLGQWGVTVSPRLNISERIDAQRKVDRAYAAHKAYIDKTADNHSKTQKGRSFVFVAMPKNAVQTAQPLTHIAPDMLTRLAILACHMAHDSNLLMVACRGGRKVMRKSDIESCLKLTPHKFRRFWGLVASEKKTDRKYEVLIDAIRYLETHWCCNGVCALGPVLAVDPMPSNIRGAMSLWIYLERTSEGWVIHSIRIGLAALPGHEIRRDITMYDGGTKTRWAGTACLPRCF